MGLEGLSILAGVTVWTLGGAGGATFCTSSLWRRSSCMAASLDKFVGVVNWHSVTVHGMAGAIVKLFCLDHFCRESIDDTDALCKKEKVIRLLYDNKCSLKYIQSLQVITNTKT